MRLRALICFFLLGIFLSSAIADSAFDDGLRLVGKTFYAYYPRESCKELQIRVKPENRATPYSGTGPRRFVITQQIVKDYQNYYEVRFEDGLIGYVDARRFMPEVDSFSSLMNEEWLNKNCYSKFSPPELQAQIEHIRAEAAARVEEERRRKAHAEAIALEVQKQKEIEAAEDLKNRRENASSYLKRLPKDEFCEFYGRAVRDESMYDIGDREDALALVKSEARRRSISFVDKLIKNEQFQIGNSECQLLAALGKPDVQNRTVGNWGVHIQHVYGRTYVYTKNGRVTSWQD